MPTGPWQCCSEPGRQWPEVPLSRLRGLCPLLVTLGLRSYSFLSREADLLPLPPQL